MENNRIKLHKVLKEKNNPDTGKPYTKKTYSEFKTAYFTSIKGTDTCYDQCKNWGLFTGTKDAFYKLYACDLEYSKKNVTACGGTNDLEKCNKDKESLKSKGYVAKSKEYYDTLSTDVYDKQRYLCKSTNKYSYWVKKKETPAPDDDTPAPGPISSKYQDCTGKKIRFNGCKDTDGIINRVQGCLGVKQDNFFGPKTEEQLKLKTGKEYFTTDQVDAICSGKLTPDGESGAGTTAFSWDTLIENEQIYNSGLKYKIKDGTEVYIIKRELDTDKKLPLDTLSGADPEKFDYFVYFPIPQGQTRGNYGKLIFYTTPNGERKVKVDKNQNWKWEAEENIESFDVMEGSIKKLLNNILSEQKHYGGPADRRSSEQSGGSPSTSQTSGGQQTGGSGVSGVQQTGGSEVTNVKPNPNDVKKVIEPIRLETIGLLNQIKENPKFKLAASAEDRKNLDDAITLLENFDSSKACDNITLIDENLTFLNQMIKANEGGFGKKDIVDLAKQVRTNLEKVKSECQSLENEAVSKSKISQQQGDLGNKQQGDQGNKQQVDQGNKQQVDQNVMKQEAKTVECSIDKLIQYVVDGLQGVSNDLAKITKQREDLCYCYKTGKFNDMNARGTIGDLFKEKFEDIENTIDANVASEKQISRKLRNKKLGWNEISDLIKGEGIYDVTLNRNYIDRYFGTDRCKATVVTESTKSVRDIINEAVNQKRNNKSKIGSLISEAVVAKRKEKTRDVIAEDLIRMIKGY